MWDQAFEATQRNRLVFYNLVAESQIENTFFLETVKTVLPYLSQEANELKSQFFSQIISSAVIAEMVLICASQVE